MKRKSLGVVSKILTSLFLLVYSFTPSVMAIDDLYTTDTSQDILEEGISDPEWITNGSAAVTSDVVVLNKTYVAPQDSDVTITFTKLPDNPSTLSIKQITLTQEEVDATGAVSNIAYDITTDMVDGTFKYDLTLPSNGNNTKIGYVENKSELTTGVNELDSYVSNGVVISENITHFTVFLTYAEASFSTPKTAYKQGETVYMNATELTKNSGTYYRIDVSDPDGNTTNVASCKEDVSSLSGSYTLSGSAVLGDWNAILTKYTGTSANYLKCNNKWSPTETINSSFTVSTNSVSNPPLTQSCGLDIALVIDISSSIDSTELNQMKSAMISLVDSLDGTPTQFSVTKFGTSATVVQPFTSDFSTVKTSINNILPGVHQGTNWKEAISAAASTFDPRANKPNLMIFASDGNPTFPDCGGSSTCPKDVDSAKTQANIAKSAGIRILALGIGNELNTDNLKAISGNVVNGTNLLTTDVITTNFSNLATQLATFASQTCGGTISVNKYLENTSTPGGTGWTFALSGTSSATLITDANGQVNTGKITAGTYSVTETLINGYSLLNVECRNQLGNTVGTSTTNGVQSISVNDSDIITCNFVNTAVCTAGQHTLEGQVKGGSYTTGNLCSDSGDCWSEGENVPARLTIGGLVVGRQYSVVLGHDYKDSNGIIGYQNFNTFSATGASGLTTSLPVYTASDSTAEYTISFTATASTVVLNWNALLSDEAGQWNGASLHYRLVSGACGGSGNKDIPINPGKIVILGSFTPIKSTDNGANPSNWTFNLAGLTNVNGIASGATASGLSLSANNGDATYTITEVGLSGWELASVSSPCFVDGSLIKVTLTKENPDVSCTFVNKLKTGKIIVDKVTNPSGDAQSFGFTATGTGYSNFSLKDSDTPNEQTLVPGTYTISENSVAGWTNTNASCTSSIGDNETIGNLELDSGETITCTFTNTKYGNLEIVKDANPNTASPFSFTATGSGLSDFSLTDDGSIYGANTKTFTNLLPGTYSIIENAVYGWDLNNVTCSDGSINTAINLSAGENITCTFTNLMRGAIGGHKYNDADGDYSTTGDRTGVLGWTIYIDTNKNGSLDAGELSTLTDLNGSYEFSNLVPGTYQLREALSVGGWYKIYPTSDYIDVTLSPGASNYTNDFINVKYPNITVLKNVDTNADGIIDTTGATDWTWDVNGSGNNIMGSSISVNPGTYTISEDQKPNYHVTDLTCNGTSYGAVESQSITLTSGQDLVCTFTNTRDTGTLRIVKIVKNDNGGTLKAENFSFVVDSSSPIQFEIDGSNDLTKYAGGITYDITEPPVAGYATTYDNCTDVTVPANRVTTCTITNDDIAPTLKLVKTLSLDNGGNETAHMWNLTASGSDGGFMDEGDSNEFHTVKAGIEYTLGESGPSGYTASNWSCDGGSLYENKLTLGLNEAVTCTITNDDIAPTITLIKNVQNDHGGRAAVDDFGLTVGGTPVTSGQTLSVDANTPIIINEVGLPGYQFISITGDKCPSELGRDVTLNEGDNIVCTITNDDIQPTLTVVKTVVNTTNDRNLAATNFTMNIKGTDVSNSSFAGSETGTVIRLDAGTYDVSEVYDNTQYTQSLSADCSGTIALGENKVCTITNTDINNIPTIDVEKSANTSTAPENGGDVIYTFTVENTGSEAVRITSLSDDKFGALVGDSDCQVGTTLPGYAACSFEVVKTLNGNAGTTHTNTFTAVVTDDEGTVASDRDSETITFTDELPSITVNKVASTNEIPETGGDVTYTFTVTNNTMEPVVISNLSDNVIGDYIGDTNCYEGMTLSGNASCTFEETYTIPAGIAPATHTNTFIASVYDDEGNSASDSDDEVITFTYVPTLKLIKNVVNQYESKGFPSNWILYATGETNSFYVAGNEDQYHVVTPNINYTLSESGPDGFEASEWSCTGGTLVGNHITLAPEDDVTCTITNMGLPGTINIYKDVINSDFVGENIYADTTFNINLNGDLTDIKQISDTQTNPQVATYENLDAGQYTINEDPTDGYLFLGCYEEEQLRDNNLGEELPNTFYVANGETLNIICRNLVLDPVLNIAKINNTGGAGMLAGDSVLYTLTITAPETELEEKYILKNVLVTDILPAGFTYQIGTWTATSSIRGNIKGIVTTEPIYGNNPALWNLGDMVEGETVTLTYVAKIAATQDPGTYKDIAWTQGTSLTESKILGNIDMGIFVGTEVKVIAPVEEGDVLGITDYVTLPNTGADTLLTIGAIALAILGLLVLILNSKKVLRLLGVIFIICVSLTIFSRPTKTYAQVSNLVVKIEQPALQMNTANFGIGYVALDLLNRSLQIQCYESTYGAFGPVYTTNNGNCMIDNTVVTTDGTYEFYVTVTTGSETISSEKVSVTVDLIKPSPVTNYEKATNGCINTLKFITANDGGQTSKIQIFRSNKSTFVANSSNLIAEIPTTSGQVITYQDTTPLCDTTYFYAIRALDTAGNASTFVTDKVVVVTTRPVEQTEQEEIKGEEITPEETTPLTPSESTADNSTEETGDNINPTDASGEVKGETSKEPQTKNIWSWLTYVLIGTGLLIVGGIGYIYAKSRRARKY